MYHSTDNEMDSCTESGQFRATRLWHQLVNNFRHKVNVGRRRYLIWQYDNVFTGSNAVDVIFAFLREEARDIITHDIYRENAIKVCQLLMDNSFFESVGTKGQRNKFEDSSVKFYRFLEEVVPQHLLNNLGLVSLNYFHSRNPVGQDGLVMKLAVDHLENVSSTSSSFSFNSHGLSKSCSYSSLKDCGMRSTSNLSNIDGTVECNKQPLQNVYNFGYNKDIPPSLRRHSIISSMDKENRGDHNKVVPISSRIKGLQRNANSLIQRSLRLTSARLRSRKMGVTTVRMTNQACALFTDISEDIQDALREKALTLLLTLVDVPVLESILATPSTMPKVVPSGNNFIIQNKCYTVPSNMPLQPLSSHDYTRIPLVQAATDCLGRPPEDLGKLWSVLACKIHCYKAVLDYYKSVTMPIFPETFLSLYTAIIDLLQNEWYSKLQTALQLLMIVLPWQRRNQLHRLLRFLRIVRDDIFMQVDKKINNHEAILKDFTDAILCHPLLSREHCSLLLDFLISRVTQIFLTPHCLREHVDSSFYFCQRISIQELQNLQLVYTTKALQELATSVLDSIQMPLKNKKVWLRKFQKVYPGIYDKCIKC